MADRIAYVTGTAYVVAILLLLPTAVEYSTPAASHTTPGAWMIRPDCALLTLMGTGEGSGNGNNATTTTCPPGFTDLPTVLYNTGNNSLANNGEFNDYINASRIDAPYLENKSYILSQGIVNIFLTNF